MGSAQMWMTREAGGTCSIRLAGALPPPGGSALTSEGDRYGIYRSDPIANKPGPATPRINLGWAMLQSSIPQSVRPRDALQIDVAWMVEALPTEPHAYWRYDLFVKLVDPNGRVIVQNDVVGPPGAVWRVGDVIRQRLTLSVPADTSGGAATVELSLYDRDHQRTAVFGASSLTGPESLTLRFPVSIER